MTGLAASSSPAPAKHAGGRPSIYTAELAATICARLEAGESLRSVCRDGAMPDRDTIMAWVEKNPEFSSQYAKSRDRGLDSMAEETLEIADDGTNDWMEKRNADGSTYEAVNTEHIQRSRLRVDTRKWYLSKLAPKRYGDSARVEHTGADGKDLPAIGVTDILESARLIAFALESAARMQRTPGDGAKVIEGTSAAGAANAATEPQDATQDETEGGTGK